MTMNIPIMFKALATRWTGERVFWLIQPIRAYLLVVIIKSRKCSPSIFSQMSLCWDTTDIIAITVNGVCPSCIYQWSMRCPCSNYHVPLCFPAFSLFVLSFLILQTSNLDLCMEKRERERWLIPLLKPQGGERQKSSSVDQSTFFLLFLCVDTMMMMMMAHTHTVRTGDLRACMIGEKCKISFPSFDVRRAIPSPCRTSEERTIDSWRHFFPGLALMSLRVTHRISMTCFSSMC